MWRGVRHDESRHTNGELSQYFNIRKLWLGACTIKLFTTVIYGFL
jgi:hypothetical protein